MSSRSIIAWLARLDQGWLLGWRDICRSSDERTVIHGIPRQQLVISSFSPPPMKGLPSLAILIRLDYAPAKDGWNNA